MKTVPNPSFTVKLDAENSADAKGLLMLCLNNTPQGGFDLAAIRGRSRVADALDKVSAGQQIVLEDADYAIAQEAIRGMKWGVNHRDIVKFAELFAL